MVVLSEETHLDAKPTQTQAVLFEGCTCRTATKQPAEITKITVSDPRQEPLFHPEDEGIHAHTD